MEYTKTLWRNLFLPNWRFLNLKVSGILGVYTRNTLPVHLSRTVSLFVNLAHCSTKVGSYIYLAMSGLRTHTAIMPANKSSRILLLAIEARVVGSFSARHTPARGKFALYGSALSRLCAASSQLANVLGLISAIFFSSRTFCAIVSMARPLFVSWPWS